MAEHRRVFRAPGPPRLSAGPAVAPELAVLFRPHGVGVPALHLMRSGCFPYPGAPAAARTVPGAVPHALKMRTVSSARGPAGTHSAATHWSAPGTCARCLGRASRLLEAPAPRPGTLPVALGVTALGWRGKAGRSLLALPPTTLGPAFVLSFRGGVGPPARRSRPGVQPAWTPLFVRVSFAFPLPLPRSRSFCLLVPREKLLPQVCRRRFQHSVGVAAN